MDAYGNRKPGLKQFDPQERLNAIHAPLPVRLGAGRGAQQCGARRRAAAACRAGPARAAAACRWCRCAAARARAAPARQPRRVDRRGRCCCAHPRQVIDKAALEAQKSAKLSAAEDAQQRERCARAGGGACNARGRKP